MCGLTFWLQFQQPVAWRGVPEWLPADAAGGSLFAAALEAQGLARRGPDSSVTEAIKVEADDGRSACILHLRSTVLHLRGPRIVVQPAATESGGRVLFNGEIFNVSPTPWQSNGGSIPGTAANASEGEEMGKALTIYSMACSDAPNAGVAGVGLMESDTAWLAKHVGQCEVSNDSGDVAALSRQLAILLEQLHGPFSIAIWAPTQRVLFCARDKLGRRSLVVALTASGDVCVSSLSIPATEQWTELPVTGMVAFDLRVPGAPAVHHVPWQEVAPFSQPWWWADSNLPAPSPVESFAQVLSAAVARRVAGVSGGNPPCVGVLFSGGLDSTVLAALAAENLPDSEPIELLNVSFDRAAPDRLTALCSFADLCARFGPRRFRLILADIAEEEVRQHESQICELLNAQATHLDFNIAAALWFAARGQGALCSPAYTSQAWWADVVQDEGQMAAVELEQQQKITSERCDDHTAQGLVPICRFCVLRSKPGCLHEACKLCCRKQQEAVGAADSSSGCPVHRIKGTAAVASNAVPRQGVQDLDPTCYYASAKEAEDIMGCSDTSVKAQSRVLLIGIGADELLGGYARHRTARAKRGAEGVRLEMLKDLERLWTRNLGRDDRIVADHGREARHPFLDEEVLAFIGSLPIALLAFGPHGEDHPAPDKWILRQVAASHGLNFCARFKKRAIQFGSRIARQSNVWHAGSNRQVRGNMTYHALTSES